MGTTGDHKGPHPHALKKPLPISDPCGRPSWLQRGIVLKKIFPCKTFAGRSLMLGGDIFGVEKYVLAYKRQ